MELGLVDSRSRKRLNDVAAGLADWDAGRWVSGDDDRRHQLNLLQQQQQQLLRYQFIVIVLHDQGQFIFTFNL